MVAIMATFTTRLFGMFVSWLLHEVAVKKIFIGHQGHLKGKYQTFEFSSEKNLL